MSLSIYKKIFPYIKDCSPSCQFWQRKFILFLLRRNAFDRFCDNLKTRDEFLIKNRYEPNKIVAKIASKYLDNSFIWSETPEGFKFWDRLNSEWKRFLHTTKPSYLDDNNSGLDNEY